MRLSSDKAMQLFNDLTKNVVENVVEDEEMVNETKFGLVCESNGVNIYVYKENVRFAAKLLRDFADSLEGKYDS